MERARFERWLRLVHNTQEAEAACSDCFDRLAQYVDLTSAMPMAVEELPCLKQGQQECPVCHEKPCLRQHLEQCRVCFEEYKVLRDLARLEAEGRVPSVDDLKTSL